MSTTPTVVPACSLLITAFDNAQKTDVSLLTHAVQEAGCAIVESRMSMLANEWTANLVIKGHWNNLAKLENALARLETQFGLTILTRREQGILPLDTHIPYAVELIAADTLGIIHAVVQFFSVRGYVLELMSRTYPAPHTSASMCSVNLVIGLPVNTHIAILREQFMEFCDQNNFDAILEPVKG